MCVGADRASPFTNPVQSRAGSAALFLEPSHQAAGQLATASQIEMFSHFLFRLLPVFGGAGAWLQPFCHVIPPDVLQNHREGKRDEWRHWKKRETTDFFCFLQYTWITCPEINGPIQSQFWGKWQKLIKVNRFTVTEMKQFCLCCFFFLELIDVYFSILSDLFRSIWTLPFESGWKNIYGNLHLIWTKDFFNLLEELKEKKKTTHKQFSFYSKLFSPVVSKLKKTNPLISQLSSASPWGLSKMFWKKHLKGLLLYSCWEGPDWKWGQRLGDTISHLMKSDNLGETHLRYKSF